MKKLVLTLMLCLITLVMVAQDLTPFIGENSQYGYKDQAGKVVIAPAYDYGFNFSEGFAMVELKKKWGFINTAGKVVVPLKYDEVNNFSEGLALVKVNDENDFMGLGEDDKYGFVDTAGKEVIQIKYNHATPFVNGRSEVQLDGYTFYIDKEGNAVK